MPDLDPEDLKRIQRLQQRLMDSTADEILHLATLLYTQTDIHTVEALNDLLIGELE